MSGNVPEWSDVPTEEFSVQLASEECGKLITSINESIVTS